MTLGARIALLRKEKGLSQEALGELVGVSRQAVSKWESDKAVPDIQNCIAMSKAFGISLTVLLELETEEPPTEIFTDQQLLLVEKMITEYSESQRKLRRRWRWPGILIVCALFVAAAWLWEWMGDMNRNIDYLSGELTGMQGQIISGVGDKLEESLVQERSLVTDFSAERIAADVLTNTVTLKEGTADTAVSFITRTNGQTEVVPADCEGGLTYSAEVVCPIMNEPTIELMVERDGVARSQSFYAECYVSDYVLRLSGEVRWAALQQTGLTEGAVEPVDLYVFHDPGLCLPEPLSVIDLVVGIFCNDTLTEQIQLVMDGSIGAAGDWNYHCEVDVPVRADLAQVGDTLTFVLLARDNYGREETAIISRYEVLENGVLECLAAERIAMDDGTYGTEEWE